MAVRAQELRTVRPARPEQGGRIENERTTIRLQAARRRHLLPGGSHVRGKIFQTPRHQRRGERVSGGRQLLRMDGRLARQREEDESHAAPGQICGPGRQAAGRMIRARCARQRERIDIRTVKQPPVAPNVSLLAARAAEAQQGIECRGPHRGDERRGILERGFELADAG